MLNEHLVHKLDAKPSVLSIFIHELRDVMIQKDPMRFRRNLERIGEVMAYEISKHLSFETAKTNTPLGVADDYRLKSNPVLATVLRAGLPLHQGFLNYFDRAENAIVSAYRTHDADGNLKVVVEYLAAPELEDKTVILVDPMLATGKSMVLTWEALLKHGKPAHLHIAAAIASREGVDYVMDHLKDIDGLWLGATDPELNDKAYIVPGLGDAGDLAYGDKL